MKVKDEGQMCNDLVHLDDSSDDRDDNVGDDDDDNDEYIDHKVTGKREEAIIYCRKHDDKGWHCKRPAEPPYSFCIISSLSFGHTPVQITTKMDLTQEARSHRIEKRQEEVPLDEEEDEGSRRSRSNVRIKLLILLRWVRALAREDRGDSRADDVKIEEEIVSEVSDDSHDPVVMVPEGDGDGR